MSRSAKTSATCDDLGHLWRVSTCRGHDAVSCARCYQHLSVLRMLAAYLEQHPRDEAFVIDHPERSFLI